MPVERLTPVPGAGVAYIGNYEVLHRIAAGGMGEVFLARQRGPSVFSRYVVLKRLHPHLMADEHFVQMFLNEAQIAANLSHANITHVYELFEDSDRNYVIAMEYVRGGTVLSLMRENTRGPKIGLPFGVVTRIVTAICEALHYAYFEPGPEGVPRHVIHRDVSPSNVMVGYDGQVKLVDFGIAKALQADATQATALKGKYSYMSPEQIRSMPLDHRSDIFSLGTMMWEMLVGRRLFKRDTDMQMLYAILEEPIARPSEHNAEIPVALDHIVMRALVRSRDDRYQDALEIAQDLKALANNNDWDVETSTLGRLVAELLPNDLAGVPMGIPTRTSGGVDPTGGQFRRASAVGSVDINSADRPESAPTDLADLEVEVTHDSASLNPPPHVPDSSQAAPPSEPEPKSNNVVVIAILVLVVLSSLLFWFGIAPLL